MKILHEQRDEDLMEPVSGESPVQTCLALFIAGAAPDEKNTSGKWGTSGKPKVIPCKNAAAGEIRKLLVLVSGGIQCGAPLCSRS